MPPVRRHIRLSRHTALECRIYLDPPANPNSWLLREPNPALTRIISDVKELVLQRVREERTAAHSKKKNKEVKDTVGGDDYTVSVFFQPIAGSYSLLLKNRQIETKPESRRNANQGVTTGTEGEVTSDGNDAVILVEEEDEAETGDSGQLLHNILDAEEVSTGGGGSDKSPEEGEEEDVLMQGSQADPRSGGQRHEGGVTEDKKKIGTRTTYQGLDVFEKALVLIVRRKGTDGGSGSRNAGAQIMEDWLMSTQVEAETGEI